MAMKTYRFAALGADTFVGGMRMNRFGMRFQIDEKLAEQSQRGGAVLLEETEFKAFGFTDAELKIWGSPFMSQHDVPADKDEADEKAAFLLKVSKAQARYIEIQQGLLEPHERTLVAAAETKAPLIVPNFNESVAETQEA